MKNDEYACEVCGSLLVAHNCKLVCGNCGMMVDCSDIIPPWAPRTGDQPQPDPKVTTRYKYKLEEDLKRLGIFFD